MSSQRLKLIVAYNGAPFSGWQSQANRNAIQDHIESAFEQIADERVRVHGAGRTDAGVHALAQCAHVDLPKRNLPPARWRAALNAHLPPAIRILRCSFASPDFHARYSAKGKIYRYRIWSGEVLPPLELGQVWHVISPLDVHLVKAAAKLFAGTHDFAAFAANRGKPEPNTTRTLRSVKVRLRGRIIVIEIECDGFLYKMMRLIVGAITECGLGKISVNEVAARLRHAAKSTQRLAAPPEGLFLVRVRY